MNIWKHHHDIDALNKINENTLVSHLGILIEEIGPDFIRGTMPVDFRTKQLMGLLHGGASVVLAESLGSIGSYMMVDDLTNISVVGIDIHATHLNSATKGRVTGIAKPIKIGKTLHVWQIDIIDDNHKPICHAKLSVLVRKK